MRENRTPGSARGLVGNGQSYLNLGEDFPSSARPPRLRHDAGLPHTRDSEKIPDDFRPEAPPYCPSSAGYPRRRTAAPPDRRRTGPGDTATTPHRPSEPRSEAENKPAMDKPDPASS